MDFSDTIGLEIDPIASLAALAAFGFSIFTFTELRKEKAKRLQKEREEKERRKKEEDDDWRRKRVCELVDRLCEKSWLYWACGESRETKLETSRLAVEMRVLLKDIEHNANQLGVDISSEVAEMKEAATGGLFESANRKSLKPDDNKYSLILLHAQAIQGKMMASV